MWYLLCYVDSNGYLWPSAFLSETKFCIYLDKYNQRKTEYDLIPVAEDEFHLHVVNEGVLSTQYVDIMCFADSEG